MCQFMPSTFLNGIYNPGDWKGARKQDNTKANYTHKKEKLPLSSLSPSMVARQPNSAIQLFCVPGCPAGPVIPLSQVQ